MSAPSIMTDQFQSLPQDRPPPLTCQRVLQQAAQDNTQLYLSRLPPELREVVDRLMCCVAPAWHFTGELVSLDLGDVEGGGEIQYAVRSNGERLVVLSASRV